MDRPLKKPPPEMLDQLHMLAHGKMAPRYRIMVTGGAGYIGSAIVRELVEAEHDVLIFDNLSNGQAVADARANLVAGDMLDASTFSAALQLFRPDLVIHLAGPCNARDSVQQPGFYYDSIINSAAVLAECGRLDCWGRRVLFASSCAVYGNPSTPGGLVDETGPLHPVSPYGFAKVAAEQIFAEALADRTLAAAVSLRLFNVAGASPGRGNDARGIGDATPGRIVPALIHTASAAKRDRLTPDKPPQAAPITVSPYAVRDYVHISDVARAFVSAAKIMARDGFGRYYPFNIGRGEAVTMPQLVEAVKHRVGDFDVQHAGAPSGDAGQIFADASAAMQALTWRPQFDLAAIVETADNFHHRAAR